MEPLAGDGLTPLLPLARALRAAVPERPADDGLFGPTSVVWRLHRDRSFPIASIRSLMLQALHPLAMAGVADHSDWRRDPFGRLEATSRYVLDPPDLDEDTRETWRELGQVAIGTLPGWARSLYGLPMPPAEALERQAVRQLLGVLDLGFESLPGVLEARQRIELRVRARTR